MEGASGVLAHKPMRSCHTGWHARDIRQSRMIHVRDMMCVVGDIDCPWHVILLGRWECIGRGVCDVSVRRGAVA